MYQVLVDVPFAVHSNHLSIGEFMSLCASYLQKQENTTPINRLHHYNPKQKDFDFVGEASDCIEDLRTLSLQAR